MFPPHFTYKFISSIRWTICRRNYKEFTGGASIGSGDIMLTTPEIAENGNTVPIGVGSKIATIKI